VAATTHLAKDIGQMLSERDPVQARARDARLLAAGGGQPQTLIRQDLIPGLRAGLLDAAAPLAGSVFPQPIVRRGSAPPCLLDELTEPGFRLVIDERCDAPAWHALAQRHGVELIVLGVEDAAAPASGAASHHPARVLERDALVHRWFASAGLCGALVRPDHYVFGGFADLQGAARLLNHARLRTVLREPSAQALQGA
jgi:3-(3-hydroxy-phenyl)propionate hydroxylase